MISSPGSPAPTSSPGLGVDRCGSRCPGAAAPLVVTRASSGWSRLAEAGERARLGAAEARDLRRASGAAPASRASEGGTPTLITSRIRLRSAVGEARVVEHSEPDRLEGGERDRAALLLELVERRRPARSAPSAARRTRPTSAPARIAMLPTWKNGSGVQKRSLGRQADPLGDPLALRHDRRVQVHAALRVGRRAGGVEHQAVVVAAHLGLRGEHRRGVDARRRPRRSPASSRPDHDAARSRRAAPPRAPRRRRAQRPESACRSGGSRSSSSRALKRALTGTGIAPRRIAPSCSANASSDALHQQPDAVALADARAVEAARHLERGLGELPVAGTLSREDDRIARRARRAGRRARRGSAAAAPVSRVRPSRQREHIALFYRTVG